MGFAIPCERVILYLLIFSLVQILESKTIHHNQVNISSKKLLADPNGILAQLSEQIDQLSQDYMIEKLRQNTFKALQKLTENWEIVPKRNGRQVGEEAAISTVGASLNIASVVIRSVVEIFTATFGGSLSQFTARFRGEKENPKRDGIQAVRTETTENPHFPIRDARGLNSEYNDLKTMADSLRFSSYADQLSGALSILVEQQGTSSRIKRETIKSTVDYILDVYVATNGKTQALFLPKLFDGIPRKV